MAKPQDQQTPRDGRSSDRQKIRTVATIITTDEESSLLRPMVYRAWTENISATGAALVCDKQMHADRVWIRLLLPGLQDKLVECEIIRSSEYEPESITKRGPQFVYGVRFAKILSDEEFELMCAGAEAVYV